MASSLDFWIDSWIFLSLSTFAVTTFAKSNCEDAIGASESGAKTLLRRPFCAIACHLARSEVTPSSSPEKWVCVFSSRSGMRGEASGRGAARARHFRTHPPPSTGHYGFFSRHPPVRWRQRPAQVRAAPALRREHRFDATAAADVPRDAKFRMIRPPRERRARARRDVPVGSDDPGLTSTPPAASPGPPPRARTSRPRATSRCVPSSCAFFEIFGDARGHERKRDARSTPDVARVRVARAREPPRARWAIDPGHGRTRSSRFRSVPTRVPPHPRHRRLVRMRHPGVDAPLEQVAPARFSNHERAWLAHSVTAPPAVFFVIVRRRARDLVAHLHDLPRSPRPHHVTPKDPRCGRCSLHRQGG